MILIAKLLELIDQIDNLEACKYTLSVYSF